ncbi:MAG TPA: class I SAM-dependent methyltransferase [Ktedonosporobacter sp.]|jgi:SAM-dependent methyltransferase|nr:class I SAM-dependent methyltransferase [Ktedonosporobacter sp.]
MSAIDSEKEQQLFENPFQIEDLMVFDDDTLRHLLNSHAFGLTIELLGHSLQAGPELLTGRIERLLPVEQRDSFLRILHHPVMPDEEQQARRQMLDNLFWELTYWKTPELYEELVEGEWLHPALFPHLAPDLAGRVVLDVGAGTGRASFECLRYGAEVVYAMEPSPGLRHILERKRRKSPAANRLLVYEGRFDAIPFADDSMDLTLACSAFTAASEQGGEPGLAEMLRVTRAGGKIVLIWPRLEDREWLLEHGFNYVSLPISGEMRVHFHSLRSAIECARRFYARNRAVVDYIRSRRRADIPFSVIGVNPPCDYCWLEVS